MFWMMKLLLVASTQVMPSPATLPKTVNPPLLESRKVLSARLTNHSSVALFGSPPSFAMAIVPFKFDRVGELPYSLGTVGFGLFGLPSKSTTAFGLIEY